MLCVVFLILLNLCSCKTENLDIHMFANLEECQRIKNMVIDNAEVIIYTSPVKDEFLKELEFREWFGCEYVSENLSFELLAYEFSNNDIAMTYFKNATGKKNDPNPTFCDSTGMRYFTRIVVVDNMAYTICCKKSNKENVVEFLNSWFTVDVTERFLHNSQDDK